MKRTVCIGSNVISPLGMSCGENFAAIAKGVSGIRMHENPFGVEGTFPASLFNREQIFAAAREEGIEGHSFFETIMIMSARRAIEEAGIAPRSPRTAFIFSSCKGNVEKLPDEKDVPLADSAAKVLRHFGNPGPAFVVSNACISGLAAIIAGQRRLLSGGFDHAVIVGAEVQSRFILSGFSCLKALSPVPCRPFDASREGLNLGEAAATIVLSLSDAPGWEIASGAIRNDANHISGPSRTGEGSYNALRAVLPGDLDGITFIGVHGTATPYNDEMESIALHRAGLTGKPVSALKSYFGHTMGAAGIVETLMSIQALENGVLPGVIGYRDCGVSYPLDISPKARPVSGNAFLKLLSGFGGCNAAMYVRR